jgi:hypothetical protein
VPIYNEYLTLKKILRNIDPPEQRGDACVHTPAIRQENAADLLRLSMRGPGITKENGRIIISVPYNRTVPIAGNVSLLFDFRATNRQ